MTGLAFGPLNRRTLFICIDMQRLFLEPGPWYCPGGLKILPRLHKLAEQAGNAGVFTQFITAETAELASGRWRHYYQHWAAVTRREMGDEKLALHSQLANLPGKVFAKTTHDAFASNVFAEHIARLDLDTLILSGIETDVCVLATALSGVDRGYRVIVVRDAVASSVSASHDACMAHVFPRFDRQIELADCATVIAEWSSVTNDR